MRPALAFTALVAWALLSIVAGALSWPRSFPPRERDTVRCFVNGEMKTALVHLDPYRDALLLETLTSERTGKPLPKRNSMFFTDTLNPDGPNPYDDLRREKFGKGPFSDELCRMQEATGLPLDVVYTYADDLRASMKLEGFSATLYEQEARKKDAAADEDARESSARQLWHEQIAAIRTGALVLLGGVVVAYAAPRAGRIRMHYRFRANHRLWVAAVPMLALAAFFCLWLGFDREPPAFERAQWLLLGGTVGVFAVALWVRQRRSTLLPPDNEPPNGIDRP